MIFRNNIAKGLANTNFSNHRSYTPTHLPHTTQSDDYIEFLSTLKNQHMDAKLNFVDSLYQQPIVYITWIIMIIIVMTAYTLVIGFGNKFTMTLGIILFIILVLNMILSGIDSIDSYETELELYNYVESNAQAFLPFGIALAALIVASDKHKEILTNKAFLSSLLMATTCFVLVLTIVWMPKESGLPIRLWRDIKTCLLALGGITVIALVGEFVIYG